MWCEKSFNTVEMLPDFFKNIEEFNVLTSIYDNELTLLQEHMKKTINNFFIVTADDQTLDKYCLLFDIDVNQDKLTNIKSKLAEIPPYNLEYLENAINRISGGYCSIIVESNYKIKIVYTSLYADIDESIVKNEIYNIIPCNIEVDLTYDFITYEKLYEYSYSNLQNQTWKNVIYGMM